MKSVNKVILLGNLGANPELAHTVKGSKVASFSMAMNEQWTDEDGKKQERTTWMEVNAWGGLATAVFEHLKKGSRCHVIGHLVTSSYEDKQGIQRRSVKVTAEDVAFL